MVARFAKTALIGGNKLNMGISTSRQIDATQDKVSQWFGPSLFINRLSFLLALAGRRWRGSCSEPKQLPIQTTKVKEHVMLRWALILLVVALLASAIGATAIGHTLASIAWILFVVFLVLLVISLFMGRTPRGV